MEKCINKLNIIKISDLKPGDIVLSAYPDQQSRDIADSTKGFFSHAGLYLGVMNNKHMSLDTGPTGASIDELDVNSSTGMSVIRFNVPLDQAVLLQEATNMVNMPYEKKRLIYIGLCAWDRRCYESNYGLHKLIREHKREHYLTNLNRRGSDKVCSGLSLTVLSKASDSELYSNCIFDLQQLSPNCIFEQAQKCSNTTSFLLKPFPESELNRKKKHFIFAAFSLLKN
ncbi:hypothetical protein H8Q54_004275 [Vibrio parahaemolyticus]|nr:hypothetical protein [Vibrio parahaemolyticus]